jgi:hypothetical protein
VVVHPFEILKAKNMCEILKEIRKEEEEKK